MILLSAYICSQYPIPTHATRQKFVGFRPKGNKVRCPGSQPVSTCSNQETSYQQVQSLFLSLHDSKPSSLISVLITNTGSRGLYNTDCTSHEKKKKTEMDSNGLLSYKSNKPGSKKKKKTGFVYQKLYIRSDAHRLLLLTDKGK